MCDKCFRQEKTCQNKLSTLGALALPKRVHVSLPGAVLERKWPGLAAPGEVNSRRDHC